MLHVALWEPEIPPNTGNVARLCAATGTRLHLIGRLGFRLDDRSLKRAGLDYWHAVDVVRHVTFEDFERDTAGLRVWCVETPSETPYTRADFADGDCLLFGSESSGLPARVRERYAERLVGIPMPGGGAVRSLNLATAVGVVLYDALRRLHGW
jgi:tRNA (cytidine/uridine-2'-O-)-methyltransferase